MSLIQIIEDEPAQIELLSYNLQAEGFKVRQAMDGEEGLLQVEEDPPDLIILDWMLPEVPGIEVCRRLRAKPQTKNVPIIMLTAKGEEHDRIRGLSIGADDYVVKPFSIAEVIARVHALLRRTGPGNDGDLIVYEDLSMDAERHRVIRAGNALQLSPTEYRLLAILIEKPSKVWTREQLLDRVWGRDVFVEDRTVDVHIGRLRSVLNKHGGKDLIRTVRGTGYSLDVEG